MEILHLAESSSRFLIGCIHLYEEMLDDLKLYKRKGFDPEDEIQCCFEIATNYLGRLVNEVKAYEFESLTDEIIFFKKLKPLFKAEVEFYTFCYHAELFKNNVESNCPVELENFLRRQLGRMNKFSREQHLFYEYVTTNQAGNDAQWFTRQEDDATASSHDKLMATWLALQRYEEYIKAELIKMGVDLTTSENANNLSV